MTTPALPRFFATKDDDPAHPDLPVAVRVSLADDDPGFVVARAADAGYGRDIAEGLRLVLEQNLEAAEGVGALMSRIAERRRAAASTHAV